MKTPYFSIIIPTFNRAHLLSKAIESVIHQTLEDWELLIVDDGSTDDTPSLVASYQAKDNRIKYIYQENAERSAARNNGIENAKGKYICFLDSDDYYLKNRLLFLYEEIHAQNHVFYFTDMQFVNGNDSNSLITNYSNSHYTNNVDYIANEIIGTPQVCIASTVLKKEKFNPAFSIGEDKELWMRIVVNHSPNYLRNQATVIALEHDNRSVNILKNNPGLAQLNTYTYMFSPHHPGHQVAKHLKKRIIANTYFSITKHWVFQHNRLKAIQYTLLSILKNVKNEQLKYRLNVFFQLCAFRAMTQIEKDLF